MNRLAEIEARRVEIRALLEGTEEINLEEINAELRALEAEEAEIRARVQVAQSIQAGTIATRTIATTQREPEARAQDPSETMEYRQAFMDYVVRGTRSDKLEYRTDAITGTGDIGAVIPKTIINRIVELMEETGRIWSRVTKTSVQGGVSIPVAGIKPTAVWVRAQESVTDANAMSVKQKKAATASITFGYHKIQIRVAVDLIAGTVALPIFEANIADNIAEAMVKGFEEAILLGGGTGEPLGIIEHATAGAGHVAIPETQIVQVTAADFEKYETWTQLMGKVPRSYRRGVELIMADADWSKYIEGMVDANGQPVARTTYGLDGTIQEKFLGRGVIPVEDYLSSIDDASSGDVVAILVRLEDYMVNSNMAITFRKYFDETTDEWISKATAIADGKLADANGVVLIKKK